MTGRPRPPVPGALGPEDRALWDAVGKSVKPLAKRRPVASEPPAVPARKKAPEARAAAAAPGRAPKPPPLATFDRRSRSRVARGSIEIDARLDLHGLTLERARARLAGFLAGAQARGARLVLVITGKGGSGAMRREVPHWLALPEFRPFVIGFEEAAAAHGGAGALYVRVRRR